MPTARTDLEIRLLRALRRITQYDSPDRLHRMSERDYGLPAGEAIEMAYENIQAEAKAAIKGVREARP